MGKTDGEMYIYISPSVLLVHIYLYWDIYTHTYIDIYINLYGWYQRKKNEDKTKTLS